MDDMDYASPNTYICLKQTEGDKEIEVYRWNIIKGKSSQTVEIPERSDTAKTDSINWKFLSATNRVIRQNRLLRRSSMTTFIFIIMMLI